MSEVFRIEGTDKRREFIAGDLDKTQKAHGKNVEYFSKRTGFTLLRKEAVVDYTSAFVQRALSAAKLSMGAPLALREFYYTLGQTPELMKPFIGMQAKAIYQSVLRAINDLEILCDIDRVAFTVGNLSKGFVYYGQAERFNDKTLKVGFTEQIAREILDSAELESSNVIIVVEKNAAANRLVDLGFSELTNAVIVTAGGNFNRAIWLLTERFRGKKNIVFFCDADAFGVDMLRTINVGTKSSRHLDFKFPPDRNPGIHLAGLYPSIGEHLGLPLDREQKRPSKNKHAMQRIRFLQSHGLLDQRDYDAWMRDQTFELEGLSTSFRNDKGEPIGLAIYLIEYMRHKEIPVKPPLPPDDILEKEFREEAREELKREIEGAISYPQWFWDLYNKLGELQNDLKEEVYEDMEDKYEEALGQVTAKEIKYHIYKQYAEDPERATYDMKAIAHKLKKEFDIKETWKLDDLEKEVKGLVEAYEKEGHQEFVEYESNYRFEPIHNESFSVNAYDLALKRLGAKEEDVVKVRHSIEWRFS